MLIEIPQKKKNPTEHSYCVIQRTLTYHGDASTTLLFFAAIFVPGKLKNKCRCPLTEEWREKNVV